MIWYYLTDNRPHLCLDFFLLISRVGTVGIIKPDGDVNEVNVGKYCGGIFQFRARVVLEACLRRNHFLSLLNFLSNSDSFLVFRPNRKTSHSFTIVLIPHLLTFSTLSRLLITSPECLTYCKGRLVPFQCKLSYVSF
jgi:hypothetical protein